MPATQTVAKKRKNWATLPFLRFLIYLVAGILLEIHLAIFHSTWVVIWLSCIVLYAFFYVFYLKKKPYFVLQINGFLALLGLLSFGIVYTHYRTAKNQSTNVIHEKELIQAYIGIADSEVEEKNKSYKVEIALSQVLTQNRWKKVTGRVVLYIEKSKLKKEPLQYGHKILVLGTPQIVPKPPNPLQFDYAQYLAYQNIYHLHRIKPHNFHIIGYAPPNFLIDYALICRAFFRQKFKELVKTSRESALSVALLLGIRDGLDNEVIEAYANTGTMHVLAVSGMHVSYLFVAMSFLLGFLKRNRRTIGLFLAISLFLLWFYAFITGLSASVLRAVTMFSFVLIGQTFRWHSNFYNTMALSAFILLLWQPFLLMQVGFLLSFLAVLSIVYYQPKIAQVWSPKNRLLKYFWAIVTVSIAAQIGTSPIGILYFHQFPNYFLLSNILIIPISALATYLGIALMTLCWIPYLSTWLGIAMQWNVWLMNQTIFWIERLPYALTQGIDISVLETCLMYAFLLFFSFFWWQKKQLSYLGASAICIAIITWLQISELYVQSKQREGVLFNVHQNTVFASLKGKQATIWSSMDLQQNYEIKKNSILPYLYHKGIEQIDYQQIRYDTTKSYKIWYLANKNILQVYKKLSHRQWQSVQKIPWDYVWFSNNSLPYSLSGVEKMSRNTQFIIDTSNQLFRAKRFKEIAEAQKFRVFMIANKSLIIK